MRLVALGLAFGVLAAPASAMAASWERYFDNADGYSVDFPGTPVASTGVYRTELTREVPVRIRTVKTDTGVFIAGVVATGRKEDSFILGGEYEYWLAHLGDIVVNNTSRITRGRDYGRYITMNCRDDVVGEGPGQTVRGRKIFKDAFGVECPNGARLTTNLLFSDGALYAIIGINTGPNARIAHDASRFALSIDWAGANVDRALARALPPMYAPPPAPAP